MTTTEELRKQLKELKLLMTTIPDMSKDYAEDIGHTTISTLEKALTALSSLQQKYDEAEGRRR